MLVQGPRPHDLNSTGWSCAIIKNGTGFEAIAEVERMLGTSHPPMGGPVKPDKSVTACSVISCRRFMRIRGTWATAFVFAAATPVLAQQPVAAGKINISSGAAFIVRGTTDIPATVGDPVYESDSLRT